jgi:hypothetical protein
MVLEERHVEAQGEYRGKRGLTQTTLSAPKIARRHEVIAQGHI